MTQECVLSEVLRPGLRVASCGTAAGAISVMRDACHSDPGIPARTNQASDLGLVWVRPKAGSGMNRLAALRGKACASAWGLDADRLDKPLIRRASQGSPDGADSHPATLKMP
jgi:hypothetical protein